MGQKWIERGRRLIAALEERDDPAARSLAANLMTCGVDWNGRYTCRCPACGPCRMRYIRAQQREVLARHDGLGNDDLAFVSLVAGGSPDLERADEIIVEATKATRNRIAAERYEAPNRWGGVALSGWYEIDAVSPDQVPLLGSDRRALLPQIATIASARMAPTWIITYHAIITLGGSSRAEITDAFARQWPAPYQVDVRDLDAGKPVTQNINSLVGYANKHSGTTTLGAIKEPWPVSWEADLYSWLATKRSAFEFCRFRVGPSIVCDSPVELTAVDVKEYEPLPFIHSISTFPMYNFTGGSGR
jgi:hypothetical protein